MELKKQQQVLALTQAQLLASRKETVSALGLLRELADSHDSLALGGMGNLGGGESGGYLESVLEPHELCVLKRLENATHIDTHTYTDADMFALDTHTIDGGGLQELHSLWQGVEAMPLADMCQMLTNKGKQIELDSYTRTHTYTTQHLSHTHTHTHTHKQHTRTLM